MQINSWFVGIGANYYANNVYVKYSKPSHVQNIVGPAIVHIANAKCSRNIKN